VVTHDQARAYYDRRGSSADRGRRYDGPANRELALQARLHSARHVVEFGCETGRFAESLLANHLAPYTAYYAFDVSSIMVERTRDRLARFGPRVVVEQTDGSPVLPMADAGCDRFISAYVFDLLSRADAQALMEEAARVLAPGGLLCISCLTKGSKPMPKLVSGVWTAIHRARPLSTGGSRPVSARDFLLPSRWRLLYWQEVTSLFVPSEVLIAERLPGGVEP